MGSFGDMEGWTNFFHEASKQFSSEEEQQKHAEKITNDLINRHKELDKKRFDWEAEELRKKKEVPFGEKIAKWIDKGFKWFTNKTIEEIPVIKDYVDYDKLRGWAGIPAGEAKWELREEADKIDKLIKEADDYVFDVNNKLNENEKNKYANYLIQLRNRRQELQNILGYGINLNLIQPHLLNQLNSGKGIGKYFNSMNDKELSSILKHIVTKGKFISYALENIPETTNILDAVILYQKRPRPSRSKKIKRNIDILLNNNYALV
jgi:hypothetical protein